MGKIKKILENELVGGTERIDIYPVTSTKAVYDENNEKLDNVLNNLKNGIDNCVTLTSEQNITAAKTFSGGISMNNTQIKDVKEPTDLTDAVNKSYIDSKVDNIPVEKGTGEGSIVQKGSQDYPAIASGRISSAFGMNTKSIGNYSFSEGEDTQALGEHSHVEGFSTIASSSDSHAEGAYTRASGGTSHAEGENTEASGYASHAEGTGTITLNKGEHAEGLSNLSIINKTIHTVGIGSAEDNVKDRKNAHEIHLDGNHYIFGIGGYDGKNSQTEGIKSLQEVIANTVDLYTEQTITAKKTFSAGINLNGTTISKVGSPVNTDDAANKQYVDTKIDDIPIEKGSGENSVQQKGTQCIASGLRSHAEGYNTQAIGQQSHAEGEGTKASGLRSHAEGYDTTSDGGGAHSEGQHTRAFGQASHVEGHSANLPTDEIIKGSNNEIIATWKNTKFSLAKGIASHVEGKDNLALSTEGHAEGLQTIAVNVCSHSEGINTIAGIGNRPVISPNASAGHYSHAEGNGTQASGNSSHAEGKHTLAAASYSHSEGLNTEIESFADCSHVEGQSTIAKNLGEHAEGTYNVSNIGSSTSNKTRHSVGIGTNNTNRKNALEIMQNGDVYIVGVGNYQGTTISSATPLANFINSIHSDLGVLSSDYDMYKETIQVQMSELDSLARGAQRALVYADYSKLVTALNAGMVGADVLPKGQSIYIQQLDVPDLWVSNFRAPDELTEYTYTNDDDFLEYIKGGGWIGCHQLSLLETAKVDLSNTASKAEVTALQAEVAALKAIINEITTKE